MMMLLIQLHDVASALPVLRKLVEYISELMHHGIGPGGQSNSSGSVGGECKVTAVVVLGGEGKVTAVTVLGGEVKVTALLCLIIQRNLETFSHLLVIRIIFLVISSWWC
jgi:hypothetical protein